MRASSSRPAATAASASKPYDRPAKASSSKTGSKAAASTKATSSKGKAKATTAPSDGIVAANIGAPATHGQTSRKGKKAWRKNVDVADIELSMERSRAEERVTGGKIAEKKDGDLFTIDTTGDVEGEYTRTGLAVEPKELTVSQLPRRCAQRSPSGRLRLSTSARRCRRSTRVPRRRSL